MVRFVLLLVCFVVVVFVVFAGCSLLLSSSFCLCCGCLVLCCGVEFWLLCLSFCVVGVV